MRKTQDKSPTEGLPENTRIACLKTAKVKSKRSLRNSNQEGPKDRVKGGRKLGSLVEGLELEHWMSKTKRAKM